MIRDLSYSLASAHLRSQIGCSTLVAGSISSLGRLWNMTGQFSEDVLYFPTERKKMQTIRTQLNDRCYKANEFATKKEKKLKKTKL